MNQRVTTRWIRTFVNAHKLSSFQDKMKAVLSELNPYYLLEWLVVEKTEEDESFWNEWEFERTPGLEKNSHISIESCFRDQMLPDLLLCEAVGLGIEARLATAFEDLRNHYGSEIWNGGLEKFIMKLEQAEEQFELYGRTLQKEMNKLEQEATKEREELRNEASTFDQGEFDLKAEERLLQLKWERRKDELPVKLLQRIFPGEALVRYMGGSGIQNPVERVRKMVQLLRSIHRHSALKWAETLKSFDVTAVHSYSSDFPMEWSMWLSSYMSRSELTRGWLPVEDRQKCAIRWIALAVNEGAFGPAWLISAAFRAKGWEVHLAEPEFHSSVLHAFVWHSLADERLRKRLREELILLRWDVFKKCFKEEEADHFDALSWIFVLDPENVQQRLLRDNYGDGEAEEVIRKLCLLYAEGIKRGLDAGLVSALFDFLSKHDKDLFYSFVFSIKSLEEAIPILELNFVELSLLFQGDGVRQATARKHLLQIFFGYLENLPVVSPPPQAEGVQKLASILAGDKRAAVVGWLKRHERHWRKWVGADGGKTFTKLLRFRWIGTIEKEAEQDRAVREWLQRHSDWVQFETDVQPIGSSGTTFKIVRPGAIDAETGEVLVRVFVRVEWTDQDEINQLLDDLKLL